jgi:hypothetical protein
MPAGPNDVMSLPMPEFVVAMTGTGAAADHDFVISVIRRNNLKN